MRVCPLTAHDTYRNGKLINDTTILAPTPCKKKTQIHCQIPNTHIHAHMHTHTDTHTKKHTKNPTHPTTKETNQEQDMK